MILLVVASTGGQNSERCRRHIESIFAASFPYQRAVKAHCNWQLGSPHCFGWEGDSSPFPEKYGYQPKLKLSSFVYFNDLYATFLLI